MGNVVARPVKNVLVTPFISLPPPFSAKQGNSTLTQVAHLSSGPSSNNNHNPPAQGPYFLSAANLSETDGRLPSQYLPEIKALEVSIIEGGSLRYPIARFSKRGSFVTPHFHLTTADLEIILITMSLILKSINYNLLGRVFLNNK